MFLTAFTGGHAANHFRAVGYGLFTVERALRTGKALTNNLRVFVY